MLYKQISKIEKPIGQIFLNGKLVRGKKNTHTYQVVTCILRGSVRLLRECYTISIPIK